MSKLYVSEVLRIARSQIGYKEKASNSQLDDFTANAGSNNYTKFARDVWEKANPHYYQGPKNGYAWCALFCDWVIWKACGEDAAYAQQAVYYTGPYGAGCGPSVQYYSAAGKFYKRANASPRPGDQIFFGTASDVQHTGLVESVADGKVTTIEGNASNQVMRKTYALNASNIYGYGRPRYDGDAPPAPAPAPAPAEFPFQDVPKGKEPLYSAVKWLWEKGATVGTSATTYSPDRPITRGEEAIFLWRLFGQK